MNHLQALKTEIYDVLWHCIHESSVEKVAAKFTELQQCLTCHSEQKALEYLSNEYSYMSNELEIVRNVSTNKTWKQVFYMCDLNRNSVNHRCMAHTVVLTSTFY